MLIASSTFGNCDYGAGFDDSFPFDYSVSGPSATGDFILCSMMRKLLVIFIAAFGRSSTNVSVQQI